MCLIVICYCFIRSTSLIYWCNTKTNYYAFWFSYYLSIGSYHYDHNNIPAFRVFYNNICNLVALYATMLLHYYTSYLLQRCLLYNYIHTIICANCFRSITLIDHLKRLRYVLFNRQICLCFFHQINNHYIMNSRIHDAVYFANAREWFRTNHCT